MRRVMIVGQPGSGKSTLARDIGRVAGLPVVHIDKIHWQSGWVERAREEKTRLCLEAQAREAWVFEGGHSVTWADRYARCDLLIWLDFPLWLRSWRVLKRTVRYYGQSRPDLPEGCPEQVSFEFYRWIWDTRQTGRVKPAALLNRARAEGKPAVHLTSARDVRRYLAGMEASRISFAS